MAGLRAPTGSPLRSPGAIDVDGDAEIAMRRHHFLDQRRQRHAVERLSACRQFGELGEDVAAARGLLAQKPHVVAVRRVGRDRAFQLLGDHRDGGERRAELVRCCGRKPVKLRKMLLARQHQFGRGKRVGELTRLLGDLPGIDADEADREQNAQARRPSCRSAAIAADLRCPTAAGNARTPIPSRRRPRSAPSMSVKRGGSAVADSSTGPRNMKANGFCSPPVRNSSTASSAMSKASSQAARSGSSRCVRWKRSRSATLSQAASAIAAKAGINRQLEIEPVIDNQHCGGLADDGEPAQPHQRVEAHIAARVVLG